ncbi:MAG: hypothetical protein LBE91_21885 [Tannerella sp.]|jgi:hypothetical protein|nr:hypothetical protein [Tannerella sp.]
MKKDIFIDNNIASKFSNPQDKEYIKLTQWLLYFDETDIENKDNYAHLVVSKKLLGEYNRSAMNAISDTSIPLIINKLLSQGRLNIISNQDIKNFQASHFTNVVKRRLRSNNEDREHIPLVLLSDRKYALTRDDNFKYDLDNFRGFSVRVEKKPENLPYDE